MAINLAFNTMINPINGNISLVDNSSFPTGIDTAQSTTSTHRRVDFKDILIVTVRFPNGKKMLFYTEKSKFLLKYEIQSGCINCKNGSGTNITTPLSVIADDIVFSASCLSGAYEVSVIAVPTLRTDIASVFEKGECFFSNGKIYRLLEYQSTIDFLTVIDGSAAFEEVTTIEQLQNSQYKKDFAVESLFSAKKCAEKIENKINCRINLTIDIEDKDILDLIDSFATVSSILYMIENKEVEFNSCEYRKLCNNINDICCKLCNCSGCN